MVAGLDYFKEVYGEVPEWVQKMHRYKPEILDYYTALRSEAMTSAALTVKEKDGLLIGMNASRHYERSMIYHTKGAIDAGLELEELVEYLIMSYAIGGEKALQLSLQSFNYAIELLQDEIEKLSPFASTVEIIRYYGQVSSHAKYFEDLALAVEKNKNIMELLLTNAAVTAKLKYLLMIGSYAVLLQNGAVDYWTKKARDHGVREEEMAEVGFISLLTAGIPAWFEMSDALI